MPTCDAPFAVVVGCSDARVPTEMIFGQGFNDLFVIRVAGNVLGDVCLGSIDFAVNALSESVKVVVMLGHSGTGQCDSSSALFIVRQMGGRMGRVAAPGKRKKIQTLKAGASGTATRAGPAVRGVTERPCAS